MIIKENLKEKLTSSDAVYGYMWKILKSENQVDQDKEHLWVIGMNNANRIQYIELVNLGILDQSITHPREIFRMAIMKAISRMIIVHNHPSGSINPSEQDLHLTSTLKQASDIIGIEILDHLIISEEGYYSFREQNKL